MRSFEGKSRSSPVRVPALAQPRRRSSRRKAPRVVIAARRTDQGDAVLRQIEALGGEGLSVRTDVTKAADINGDCTDRRRIGRRKLP